MLAAAVGSEQLPDLQLALWSLQELHAADGADQQPYSDWYSFLTWARFEPFLAI